MKYRLAMNIDKYLKDLLTELGINSTLSTLLDKIIVLIAVIMIAVIINFISVRLILPFIRKLSDKTNYKIDDLLVQRHVITHLLRMLAPVIIYVVLPVFFDQGRQLTSLLQKLCVIYIIFQFVMVLNGLVLALYDNYNMKQTHHQRPIRGFLQVVQVLLFFVGFIVMISVVVNKSPAALFAGLGASAAILSLVFKDVLTGFIAGVQLSLNDMVRPGDWITLNDNQTDGIVQEITLITVKIKNFDNSIATVPPTVLVTNTFKNWREMLQSNGRLVAKSIFVDKASVKFCTPELLEKIKSQLSTLAGYQPVNGNQLTNTGLFRNYMEHYLKSRPDINPDMGFKVGELESTDRGLPIRLFFFSKNKEDKAFEQIQSDVFDHAMSVLPVFELVIK